MKESEGKGRKENGSIGKGSKGSKNILSSKRYMLHVSCNKQQ